jgi:gliding motility-associated-like protein
MRAKGWIGCFLLFASTVASYAQPYTSRDGNFQVDQIKGCAPLTVNVTTAPTLCGPGVPCEFFYETDPLQDSTSYIYTKPGTYKLRVLFQDKDTIDQINITVLPDTPPEFEVYSCQGNSVQVNVTDSNPDYTTYDINFGDGSPVVTGVSKLSPVNHLYTTLGTKNVTVEGRSQNDAGNCTPGVRSIIPISSFAPPTIDQLTVLNDKDLQLDFINPPNQDNVLYRLEIAVNSSTNFQNLQNVYRVSSTTVSNLRTDDNFYCFRLAVYNPCNNATAPIYSNTICSSNFDVTPQNNINRLAWVTSSAGVSNYAISKNPGTALNANSTTRSLNDTDIICGTEYCYQQTTNYANGTRSMSLQKCATAISTDIPTVVENISSIVGTNSSVELRWTQDPAFNAPAYTITKLVNGSFAERDTATTTTYIDDTYAMDVTSCYTINYEDACENKSPVSVEVCPLMLVGTLQEDNAVSLSWNAYAGWENGVDHYIIEKFNDQGQLLRTFNAGANVTYVDNVQDLQNQVAVYRITAIANDAGITSSISNTITVIKDPKLFYPTAFTPNRDGLNEVFNVFGQYIEVFEMRIFNRWGEMIYNTENIEQGWNGFYKGNPVPEGTYVFRATITDQAGRSFDRSGTILLLRKN